MADRIFVYIDGESHFLRSEDAWRKLHGKDACLGRLKYTGQMSGGLILVDPRAKVFWTRKMNPGVQRAYYFTSAVGDARVQYEIKVKLREFDLKPCVIPERKALSAQRHNVRQTQQLIEKAKGVDIALAVRMLEDAHNQAFDMCHLYTSDIDFLPVIEALRARGKQVCVHGYRDRLSQQSPFLHACDQFTDLENMLRNDCEIDRSK